MIYVDSLIQWPLGGKSARVKRSFADGSCHLITDGDIEELHAFARRLGLKRSWFQDSPRTPHYDLNGNKRAAAVRLGATEVDRRGFVEAIRRYRARQEALR